MPGMAEGSTAEQAGFHATTTDVRGGDRWAVAARPAAVLLVDDKPELLESLKQLVSLHGYQPDVALGGEQALARLRERDYDVVLLDLIMPGVSGHDVLEFAAREGLRCKIVVVSGDSSFSGVKHALHCGAFDFVKKPYDTMELIGTLEAALERCRAEADDLATEIRLKESEALHRFIVNSSPDLVYMLDRHGCFTFLNDRVEALIGYRKEELIGRHYSEIIDEDDLELARHAFDERRTGSRAVTNQELRLKSRNPRTGPRFFHGSGVWVELTAMGVYGDARGHGRDTFLGTYGTARDVSDRKEADEVINFQAHHDLLTRLPNRALLKDRLALAIAQARRNKRKLAVMFLDLDRFKAVNDTLGHAMGDRLLKAVANRLQSCLRSGDTLARFGGDEFMLLLPEVRTRDDVVVIAQKILDRLGTPFSMDGHDLFVGASIGIAMYPEAGDCEETLIQNADIAMYHVKGSGRNAYRFFSEEMSQAFSTRLTMERELRAGLVSGEMIVHYQPQVDARSGLIVGVEALARWRHPRQGLIEPDRFLGLAEETGLIDRVDEAVQRRALSDLAAWRAAGHPALKLSLNVSAAQLQQDGFVDRFLDALKVAGVKPDAVRIEIGESTLLQDAELIVPRLKELRRRGATIVIDDYGTGFSSLSQLRQFPIDVVKIDRTFIGDIRFEQAGASVVDALVAMAGSLKLALVAEGVEQRNQLRYLCAQGCLELQGNLFCRAVSADALPPLLERQPYRELVRDST
jgi:diguanylate cyclase